MEGNRQGALVFIAEGMQWKRHRGCKRTRHTHMACAAEVNHVGIRTLVGQY